jgi:hypothetical protein
MKYTKETPKKENKMEKTAHKSPKQQPPPSPLKPTKNYKQTRLTTQAKPHNARAVLPLPRLELSKLMEHSKFLTSIQINGTFQVFDFSSAFLYHV